MKISWAGFFKALPALVVAAESIYTDVSAGKAKKASVLQLVGIAATDAAAATPAVLDPHSATIAQAAAAEIDNIVAGYNAGGWPGALILGSAGAAGVLQAAQSPTQQSQVQVVGG